MISKNKILNFDALLTSKSKYNMCAWSILTLKKRVILITRAFLHSIYPNFMKQFQSQLSFNSLLYFDYFARPFAIPAQRVTGVVASVIKCCHHYNLKSHNVMKVLQSAFHLPDDQLHLFFRWLYQWCF